MEDSKHRADAPIVIALTLLALSKHFALSETFSMFRHSLVGQFDLAWGNLNSLIVEFLFNEPLSKGRAISEPEFKKIFVWHVLLKEVKSLSIKPIWFIFHHLLELQCYRIVAVPNN